MSIKPLFDGLVEEVQALEKDRDQQKARADRLSEEYERLAAALDRLQSAIEGMPLKKSKIDPPVFGDLYLFKDYPSSQDFIDPATGKLKILGLNLDQILGLKKFFEKHSPMPASEYTGAEIEGMPLKKSRIKTDLTSAVNWAHACQKQSARLEALVKDAVRGMNCVASYSGDREWRANVLSAASTIEERLKDVAAYRFPPPF